MKNTKSSLERWCMHAQFETGDQRATVIDLNQMTTAGFYIKNLVTA